MTVTLMHTQTATHAVYMEVSGTRITVAACPLIDENRAGYPESECTYHYTEKEKAAKIYRRYVKKYGGEKR